MTYYCWKCCLSGLQTTLSADFAAEASIARVAYLATMAPRLETIPAPPRLYLRTAYLDLYTIIICL